MNSSCQRQPGCACPALGCMLASIRVRCSWLARYPQPAHGGFVSPCAAVLSYLSTLRHVCFADCGCQLQVPAVSLGRAVLQMCTVKYTICRPYYCSNAYANQQTFGHLASWLYLLTLSLRKCTNSQPLCMQEPDAVSFCRQGEAGDCHCRDGLKLRSFCCGASASDTAMLPFSTQCSKCNVVDSITL